VICIQDGIRFVYYLFGEHMKRHFLTGALVMGTVAIGSLGAIDAAEAASLVTNGGGKVLGIDALQVGTTTYDVDFNNANFTSLFGPQNPPNNLPTFWQDPSGAQTVANAINAFLTSSGQFGSIFLGNAATYLIPYNLSGNGNNTTINVVSSSGNPWNAIVTTAPQNGGGNQPVYAVFTEVPTSTAVPTPALLPGLVGLGVAALRKKKQAAEAT
jgi:hypothetical protein